MRPIHQITARAAAAALLGVAATTATAATDQSRVVSTICRALQECYVFEDTADRAAEHYKSQLAAGVYEGLEGIHLAQKLEEDGQSILHDRHFAVGFDPQIDREYETPREDEQPPGAIAPAEQFESFFAEATAEQAATNWGFEEVRVLEGGIGYLKLNEFQPPLLASHIYAASIGFLQDTNAIIIDLRTNNGGASSGLQLLASYFFPSGQYLLNTYETRAFGKLEQTWTLPAVDGPRLSHTPVFILTSRRTFSAAESFSYSMQALDRATIVGDRTGGGAHRVVDMPINQSYFIRCPFSRNVNPVTGTNWEGTGVQPDVKVDPENALAKAHALALEAATERFKDDPIRSPGLAWAAPIINARAEPVYVPDTLLAEYAGSYGPRTVTFEGGQLNYVRGDNPPRKLIPLSDYTFMIEGSSRFKMTFERDEAGRVSEIHGFYIDGREDHSPRDAD